MTAKYRHTCKVRAESAVFTGKYWAVLIPNHVLPQQWGKYWPRWSTQVRSQVPSPSWNKTGWPLHSQENLRSSFAASCVVRGILVRVFRAGLEFVVVLDLGCRHPEHYIKYYQNGRIERESERMLNYEEIRTIYSYSLEGKCKGLGGLDFWGWMFEAFGLF